MHFHCVIPDGVFVDADGAIRFVALPAPSEAEVAQVLGRIFRRVRKLLRPRVDAALADGSCADALAAAQAHSVASLVGKPPERSRGRQQSAYLEGFSLHAGVHLHANDREGLLHLCGYGARPPLTQDRLSRLPDGRLGYRLKRPLADGTQVLVLLPSELLRRLAALVPPPRAHLVRLHGVFAPASEWRSRMVPKAETPRPCGSADPREQAPQSQSVPPRGPDSRIPWAELLLRVFREDVLVCLCGGRRVVSAFITRRVVTEILEHLGLPTTGPPIAAARGAGPDQNPPW
ncbi:MAG: transposase [Myxococcales bacterium]